MTYDDLERYRNNPARAINRCFQEIEDALGTGPGSINAAGHPFSYALDMIVATQYNFAVRNGDGIAKRFPTHARTIADLAANMSDEDWYGVFAEPSGTTFRWMIAMDELEKRALPFTEVVGTAVNNYRKLELPSDTIFTVAGIPFLLENPVEIRLMEHGGLQIVYNSEKQSPLYPLSSNSPRYEELNIDDQRYLSIHLPVRQLEVKEKPATAVNMAVGFRDRIDYNDKLYAVRAFITPDGSTRRSEMAVVFNNDVFDPAMPTLTIDMIRDGVYEASIPSVYLQSGMALGRITILTYTTRGKMNQDLSTLRTKEHTYAYYDYSNPQGKLSGYSVPLRSASTVTLDTIEPVVGGLDSASFQELKNMVVYRHRRRQVPVSNSDLTQTLLRNGYDSVKSIDFVTNRLYRTTKDLPIQETKLFEDESLARFNSSIGTYTGTHLASLEELISTANAIDNGRRITIPRGAVFDITEQTARFVPKYEIEQLKRAGNQTKIDVSGERSLVYTPFMYVIDTSDNRASIRTYRTDRPQIRYQTFRYENASLGIQAGIGQINITVDEEGYTIGIVTKSSEAYKKLADTSVGIQMSLNTEGSNALASIRGKLKGLNKDKERVWEFKIPSRFDITDRDEIDLRGFQQFGRPQDEVRVKLEEIATFIFTYAGDGQVLRSPSDGKIDQSLFEQLSVAIIETEYRVQFGKRLSSLYARIRPIIGPAQYAKYTDNVPAVYKEDVYKYENGKLVIVDGKAVLEHKAGETRYNADGSPVWEHEKGTTVYDQDDKPVLLHPRLLKYHWDFIGFDFNYLLSQDEYDATYVGLVEDFFANEVNDWLTDLNKSTLDETTILFKPRSTMGFTQVILNEGIEKTIRTDIGFTVTYYLNDEGMADNDLKNSLIKNTHQVTNEHLRSKTFSVSELTRVLKSSDVLDVKIIATAGNEPVDVITNIDDTNGFSVRKELDQTSDQLLTIKESIEIMFKRHMPRS
ncbi:hypothetical protein D9_0180 [Aeromonas phage D9]|nr:hypothetical protein D9_0180 [Aeromonas phage D9]